METLFNEIVSNLPASTRQSLEAVLGRHLDGDQRVLISVLDSGADASEAIRQRAREEFHDLCRAGTEHREQLGVSVTEADQILDEAVRAARSRKPN